MMVDEKNENSLVLQIDLGYPRATYTALSRDEPHLGRWGVRSVSSLGFGVSKSPFPTRRVAFL